MKWVYDQAGELKGPVDAAELRRLLAAGEISADTRVRQEGLEVWLTASEALGTAAPAAAAAPAEGGMGAMIALVVIVGVLVLYGLSQRAGDSEPSAQPSQLVMQPSQLAMQPSEVANARMVGLSASASDRNRDMDRYGAQKALDGDVNTAWCTAEGKDSWLEVRTSQPGLLTAVELRNGYQKNRKDKYGDRFWNSSRVRSLKVEVDGVHCRNASFRDIKEFERVSLAECAQTRIPHVVRLTIQSVFSGREHPVCISEVRAWGIA